MRKLLGLVMLVGGFMACGPATFNDSDGGRADAAKREFCFEVELDPDETLASDIVLMARNDTTGDGRWYPQPEATVSLGWNCVTTSFDVAEGELVRYNAVFRVVGDPYDRFLVGYEYGDPGQDVDEHSTQMDGDVVHPYTVWNDFGDGFDGQFIYNAE
jgi:hypothetical protein